MDLLGGYASSSEDEDEVLSSKPESQEPTTDKKENQGLAKGRKILSLASVLPQHILDQLTKGAVDDSDEEDNAGDRKKPAATGSSSTAKDQGISSLLSDLSSTKPAKGSFLKKKNTFSKEPPKERMGQAFLQTVTVETVTDDVRDIHNEAPAPKARKIAAVKSAPPVDTPVAPNPSSSSFRRPSAVPAPPPRRSLAPVATPAPPLDHQPHSVPITTAAETTTTEPETHASRKRSRRERERALRRGDFATALQGQEDSVANLQQVQPDAFTPQPETFAVPQHGIKVVPTAIYDPSAWAATTDASGKGRGKNQIHHLMASAANLELARARGMGGSNAGKVHRAKAKNKYGW